MQVGILGAHEHKILALSTSQSVSLAHHHRHVIELINLQSIQNEVHKVLVNIVHLDDEVSLIDSILGGILINFSHDSLLL